MCVGGGGGVIGGWSYKKSGHLSEWFLKSGPHCIVLNTKGGRCRETSYFTGTLWHQMTCYTLRISSQRNTHLVKSSHTIWDSTYTTSFTQYKRAVHELVLKILNVSFLVWSWSHAVSIIHMQSKSIIYMQSQPFTCSLDQSFTRSLNHLHAVSISHLHAVSINHFNTIFQEINTL